MHWAKVTQNEAVFKGRDSYTGDRQGRRSELSSASRSTSRRPGSRCFPGVDLLAPITWSQGISRQCRGAASAATRTRGNWSAGLAADIYQKYRVDLKYSGYYGDYSTNPTRPRRRGGAMGVPNGANASLSDRGWVSLTFKTTF